MKTVWKMLRSWFFTGLLVCVPTGATLYMFWWAWATVDSFALTFLKGTFYQRVPGAGAATVLVAVFVVGALARSWVGSHLVRLHEWVLLKVPVLGTVFKSVREVSGMIFDERSSVFGEVCLLEYPRAGLWSLGFIAATSAEEIKRCTNSDDSVSVFVATSPNPTSGILVFVPRAEVIILDMTPEEGFKLVMSGGLVAPPVAHAT